MASAQEQDLYKTIAEVLTYKKVHMRELTCKRGSQMLYNKLKERGFRVVAPADPEWSFIKVFQVMFQDQNHLPDNLKLDPQVILDFLAFCYVEKTFVLHGSANYCALAVIKGGEQVVYGQECKRPKTLKYSLYKIFMPALYNETTPEELASLMLEKVLPKISYTLVPAENLERHLTEIFRQIKGHLPAVESPFDHLECADGFLRLLAQRGIQFVKQ